MGPQMEGGRRSTSKITDAAQNADTKVGRKSGIWISVERTSEHRRSLLVMAIVAAFQKELKAEGEEEKRTRRARQVDGARVPRI